MEELFLLNDIDVYSAQMNMALDEVLFEDKEDRSFLRIYKFSDGAITIGRCQLLNQDKTLLQIIKNNKNSTRRITGGGAVFHDGGLTYTFIPSSILAKKFDNVDDSYKKIHSILKDALFVLGNNKLKFFSNQNDSFSGNKGCFAHPVNNDLLLGESKIAGAAQKRKRHRFIHQGEVSLSRLITEKKDFENAFFLLKESLIERFKASFDVSLVDYSFHKEQLRLAKHKAENKYNSNAWIYRM